MMKDSKLKHQVKQELWVMCELIREEYEKDGVIKVSRGQNIWKSVFKSSQ